MKKSLLYKFTSLATLASPVVLMVSCFGNANVYSGEKYDSYNDKLLKIHTKYSRDSIESFAFNNLIEYYNHDVLTAQEYPIEVSHLDNNDKMISDFIWDTNRKDKTNLPNLYFGDYEIAGVVSNNNMHLNISNYMNLNDYFPETFFKNSQNIVNVKKGEVAHIPTSMTARGLFTNRPLLAYILRVYEAKGGRFSGINNQMISGLMEHYYGENATVEDKSELTQIQTKWISIPGNPDISEYPVVDDAIFNDFESMIKFATFAKKMFVQDDSLYIIGINNIVTLLYTILHSISETSASNGLYQIQDNKLKLDFLNKGKSASLENIYVLLQEAIKYNAIYIALQSDSTTSINKFKTHEFASLFGDPSSFYYHFGEEIVGKFDTGNEEDRILLYNKVNPKATSDTGEHIGSFNKNGLMYGYIYPHNYKGATNEHDIKLNTPDDTRTLLALMSDFSPVRDLLFITESGDKNFFDNFSGFGLIPIGNQRTANLLGDGRYIAPASSILRNDSSLQMNEIGATFGPTKFNSVERLDVRYTPTDSLIPIHTNDRENSEIMKFIKWYISGEYIIDGQALVPGEYFASLTHTIFPSKNYLLPESIEENNAPNETLDENNTNTLESKVSVMEELENLEDATHVLFDSVKKIYIDIAEEKVQPFFSPMSKETYNIKNYIRIGMHSLFTKSEWVNDFQDPGNPNSPIVKKFQSISFDEFVATIKKKIQTW